MAVSWYTTPEGKLELYTPDEPRYYENPYFGEWKSKSTGKSQRVSFGYGWPPCSGNLNMSASDFFPSYQYYPYGWKEKAREINSNRFKN